MFFRWDSRKNGSELSEIKLVVSGVVGGFFVRFFFLEYRLGGVFFFGRFFVVGEVEVIKNDLWLLNGVFIGKRDLGNVFVS